MEKSEELANFAGNIAVMKKIILNIVCLLMVAAAASAQTAQKLSATKANEYAVVYSLPSTMIDVAVEAELIVKKPGEFYKYAPKYLNISDPIVKDEYSVRLLSASLFTHGVADQDETYSVQFKAGSPVFVALDGAGIPLAINIEDVPAVAKPQLPEARKAQPTPLETPAARQVISEEMMQSQSTAKKAELAAQAIFAIRQTRSDLITGQADNMPPDGKSLQLMLDNLQAQEDALMAMFVGTTATSTEVATFTVDPAVVADADKKQVVVCRLSTIDGIVAPDDLSGSPVYLDLSVITRGEMPVNDKGQELTFPKNGIPYSIPGELQATVSYDGRKFASEKLPVAQLGIVYGLAPNSFTDKKAPIYIIYDPATGALLRQGAL